jgi:hypothetical protein
MAALCRRYRPRLTQRNDTNGPILSIANFSNTRIASTRLCRDLSMWMPRSYSWDYVVAASTP